MQPFDQLVGRSLGPYELDAAVGRGGFGIVYRAHHRSLRRACAVKVLSPHLAGGEGFVSRFLREARTAAGLRHPNIVHIYDVGEEDGLYYIAMELLEGVALQRLLRAEGRLPLERAVSLLRQIADALDYAHTQGVVHRDVKPDNVIVAPDEPRACPGGHTVDANAGVDGHG